MDTGNYRNRVLNPLAERLGIPETEFSDSAPHDGDTSAEHGFGERHPGALAACKGRHTANEYMQELPESVKRMVGEVYAMLTKGGDRKTVWSICHKKP